MDYESVDAIAVSHVVCKKPPPVPVLRISCEIYALTIDNVFLCRASIVFATRRATRVSEFGAGCTFRVHFFGPLFAYVEGYLVVVVVDNVVGDSHFDGVAAIDRPGICDYYRT
jgi:hypothetical protein